MKRKLNKYLIYISFSIYSSYLLSNYYQLNVISAIVLFAVSFLSIYLINKNNTKSKNKKVKIISIISAVIMVIIFRGFYIGQYTSSKITLKSNNIKLSSINKILVNNRKYLIKDESTIVSDYDYYYNKSDIPESKNFIKVIKKSDDEIELEFKKSHDIKIYFNEVSNINVIEKDNSTKVESYKSYDLFSNVKYNGISIIKFICSISWLTYIFNLIINKYTQSNKEKKGWILCIGFAIIVMLYFINNTIIAQYTNDSYSYIAYKFHDLLKLNIDCGRMPLYPLFIRIIYFIFKKSYFEFICIIQYIIWIISISYLYKLFQLITNKYKMSTLFTILYTINFGIFGWNNLILTESLALSLTIIFIYYIIKYILNNNIKDCIISIIISLALTFIRPTSVIYLGAIFAFLLLRIIVEKQNRKNNIKCLIINTCMILLVLCYACIYKYKYGILSLNNLVVKQNFIVSVTEGYYKSSNNIEYINYIDELLDKYPNDIWSVSDNVMQKYELSELNELVKYTRTKNFKKYNQYLVKLIKDNSHVSFESYYYESSNQNSEYITYSISDSFGFITFFDVYIFIIIMQILFIYELVFKHNFNWLELGLFAFPMVIVLSSFIGTCGEFMRTAQTSLQFTYISMVYCINILLKGCGKDDKIIKEK